MAFVTRGITVEFRQPPFPPVRRRRAIIAIPVAMPETAVNENRCLIFRQNDVGADESPV